MKTSKHIAYILIACGLSAAILGLPRHAQAQEKIYILGTTREGYNPKSADRGEPDGEAKVDEENNIQDINDGDNRGIGKDLVETSPTTTSPQYYAGSKAAGGTYKHSKKDAYTDMGTPRESTARNQKMGILFQEIPERR